MTLHRIFRARYSVTKISTYIGMIPIQEGRVNFKVYDLYEHKCNKLITVVELVHTSIEN